MNNDIKHQTPNREHRTADKTKQNPVRAAADKKLRSLSNFHSMPHTVKFPFNATLIVMSSNSHIFKFPLHVPHTMKLTTPCPTHCQVSLPNSLVSDSPSNSHSGSTLQLTVKHPDVPHHPVRGTSVSPTLQATDHQIPTPCPTQIPT